MKIKSFLSTAALAVLLAVFSPLSTAQAQGAPSFFDGQQSVGDRFFYLQFPDGNYLGFYTFLDDPAYIYHVDAGFEYVIDAQDSMNGVYLYDFASKGFFYTNSSLFPYLYNFAFSTFVYYFPDTNHPGHYTSNPRYFYAFSIQQIITD